MGALPKPRTTMRGSWRAVKERVVAALALLCARPVSRIVRLTTDDVTDDGTIISLHLGEPPSPLPGAVGRVTPM